MTWVRTCPHSVHSLRAAKSFCSTEVSISITSLPQVSPISDKAATALATTFQHNTRQKVQAQEMLSYLFKSREQRATARKTEKQANRTKKHRCTNTKGDRTTEVTTLPPSYV